MTSPRPDPQDLIIFGASGDLARRRLLPALYDLFREGLLPPEGDIVGYARRAVSDSAFRDLAKAAAREHSRHRLDERAWTFFAARLHFVSAEQGGFGELAERCAERSRLLYLSTPPSAFASTLQAITEHSLATDSRLVIEKPFGHDLASAKALDDAVHAAFDESQIFRIDHFLGKESVQNILPLRFANAVFDRLWNRDAIDQVQITIAEDIGIEGRGAFYDATGALRDIIQNHGLQLLALLTMEPPASLDPDAVRDEKVKLLTALEPLQPSSVVRGQYTRGDLADTTVDAYRDEPDVPSDSLTETFVAARLSIDNERWSGVPIYLRTGKRLPRRVTQLQIRFRRAAVPLFDRSRTEGVESDCLVIRIQPDEGISLGFLNKEPGPAGVLHPAEMDFSFGRTFTSPPPDAYERLLHAAVLGDSALFVRADEVERAWEIVQPVLDSPPPLRMYPAGSWGPPAASDLIAPDRWQLR